MYHYQVGKADYRALCTRFCPPGSKVVDVETSWQPFVTRLRFHLARLLGADGFTLEETEGRNGCGETREARTYFWMARHGTLAFWTDWAQIVDPPRVLRTWVHAVWELPDGTLITRTIHRDAPKGCDDMDYRMQAQHEVIEALNATGYDFREGKGKVHAVLKIAQGHATNRNRSMESWR